MSSCEDFVERYPRDAIAEEELLEDLDGVESSVMGLYNRLTGTTWKRDMNITGGMKADDLDFAEIHSGRIEGRARNVEGTGFGYWSGRYDDINRCNTLLYYIDEVVEIDDEQKATRLKGELYAMRAFYYFHMLKIYARPPLHPEPLVEGEPLGVVLKTEHFTGVDERTFEERATIEEGYDLVEDDLNTALEYLSEQDGEFPYAFNQYAVKGLLARLHLYRGNWQQAADYAEDVINNSPVELVDAVDEETYMPVFADVPGEESLLEFYYTSADRPGISSSVAGMAGYRPDIGVGYGDVPMRLDLVNLLEEYGEKGDGHPASEMIYFEPKAGEDNHYQKKYDSHRGENYWDNLKVMRIPEMYFIAAEAYAELGQQDQAKDMLQVYRDHRGMQDVEIDVNDKDEFIDIIFSDRRVEYFCEMSHRWFDLRRRGMDIPKGVPGEDSGADDGPIEYEDFRVVDRIPVTSEMAVNENMIQNPGY